MDDKVMPSLGMFDLNGSWYPNPHLNMTADEQYDHNVKYGYLPHSEKEMNNVSNPMV